MPKGKRLKSSERRIAANRRNALLSSGPRTAAGKVRVSKNALRHGLAVSLLKDPMMAADIEALARSLLDQDDAFMAEARIVAESEFDLERIHQANVSLINSRIASLAAGDQRTDPAAGRLDPCRETSMVRREADRRVRLGTLGEAMVELCPELLTLSRYENRARSRRKRAMNELLKLKGRRS